MKTLVVHEADLSTVNIFFEWMQLVPDLQEVHELSIFYREQAEDCKYLKMQIKKAVEIYGIERVILFNYCLLSTPELISLLKQEFPQVSFELQSR